MLASRAFRAWGEKLSVDPLELWRRYSVNIVYGDAPAGEGMARAAKLESPILYRPVWGRDIRGVFSVPKATQPQRIELGFELDRERQPVKVPEPTTSLYRSEVTGWVRENIQGASGFINDHSGEPIRVSSVSARGVKESAFALVKDLPALLKQAIFTELLPHQEANVNGTLTGYALAQVGDRLVRVRLKVNHVHGEGMVLTEVSAEPWGHPTGSSNPEGAEIETAAAGVAEPAVQPVGIPKVREMLADVNDSQGRPIVAPRPKQEPLASIEGSPVKLDQQARGYIEFTPAGGGERRTFNIHLLATADRSTLAHETFHFLDQVMGDLAKENPEIGADFETLAKGLGYASAEERRAAPDVTKEERAAHLWEQYLAEGKAPVPELVKVFARLKNWLRNVYKGLQGGIAGQYKERYGQELGPLSPDVRKVFDRMLATGDELERAARDAGVDKPMPLELDPVNQQAYDRLRGEAANESDNELLHRVVEGQRKENEKWIREERQRFTDQVNAELDAKPEQRALSYLTDGALPGQKELPPPLRGDRKDKGPFERPVKDLPSTEASTDPSLPPLPRATTAGRAHRAREPRGFQGAVGRTVTPQRARVQALGGGELTRRLSAPAPARHSLLPLLACPTFHAPGCSPELERQGTVVVGRVRLLTQRCK